MTQYWANDNTGSITCRDHAGAYLASAIQNRPTAKTHKTPLGRWTAMDTEWVTDMVSEFGTICDGCRTPR